MEKIASVQDIETGIEARITELKNGNWSVTIKDLDSECVVPMAVIFKTYELAYAYAHKATG